jgi:hypothetical protein
MSKSEVATKQAAPAPSVVSAVPAYLQGYTGPTGTENIDSVDVTIPRLKIGQGLTAEVKEGLVKDGDLFINLGAQVVAVRGETLRFIPLAYAKEFILWRPREDNGGGILARARPVYDETNHRIRYKWDKQNETFEVKLKGIVKCKWTTGQYIDEDDLDQWGSENPADKSSGIAATAHLNYVVALPDHEDMLVAFSFSRTTTRAGKDLNGLLKQGRAPMFARVFTAKTFEDKREKGEFNNVKIMNDGFVTEDKFPVYQQYAKQFETGFVVDQSDEDTTDGVPAQSDHI